MRELQERLVGVVHAPLTDPLGTFGDGTVVMVEAFQHSRGLPITGVVDLTTWTGLVEAGWRLGQRLLFLSQPHLRGDDVAELQIRLAQLGFNPGRVDGIFGSQLEGALSDFQRNCGQEWNGTLTRATLVDLRRMSAIAPARHLVTDARDMAGFDEVGAGPLVVCGESPLTELVASAMRSAFKVHIMASTPTEDVAVFANDHLAALVISFQVRDELNGIHLHYWASYHSHSRRGDQLAGAIATRLARSHALPRVEVTGMALPILRETKMTTLHIEHGRSTDQVLREMATEIAEVVTKVFHRDA